MPKLATPIQYEPSLEGLNAIRPLQLADEVKTVIPYPVLCKNPPSIDKPAVGMLARCSQQGALLKHRVKEFCNYQRIGVTIFPFALTHKVTFSQRVSFVLAVVSFITDNPTLHWTNSDYSIIYKDINTSVPTFLEFVGISLYVKMVLTNAEGFISLDCYGLY